MAEQGNAVLARLAAEVGDIRGFSGSMAEARQLLDGSILGLLSEEELAASTEADISAAMAAGKLSKNCKCLTKGGWLGCTISVVIVASSAVCTTEVTFCAASPVRAAGDILSGKPEG